MPVNITEVGKNNINDFIDAACSLNENNGFWVSELNKNAKELLNLSHPFWSNADRKLFIAHINGAVAGRIAAIINHNHNDYHRENIGFFGFFETVDAEEVSRKLFESAEHWLKLRGVKVVRGPVNPSTNYSCGSLISSFDSYPQIMMPYNPPFYNEHMETLNYKKVKDLYAFIRFSAIPISERLEKIISRVETKLRPIVRQIRVSDLKREMETVRKIYNEAWAKNWGFVPITAEEMAITAKNIKPILKSELAFIVELAGKPVAFGIVIPDINVALKKINGNLDLFNIIPFMLNLKKIKQGRLILLGVKEEYRNKGLELLLIKHLILGVRSLGWSHGEISWILEDNQRIISIIKEFGGKLYKKYRLYEKGLD